MIYVAQHNTCQRERQQPVCSISSRARTGAQACPKVKVQVLCSVKFMIIWQYDRWHGKQSSPLTSARQHAWLPELPTQEPTHTHTHTHTHTVKAISRQYKQQVDPVDPVDPRA